MCQICCLITLTCTSSEILVVVASLLEVMLLDNQLRNLNGAFDDISLVVIGN